VNERIQAKPAEKSSSFVPTHSGLLQRKCACGGPPGVDGLCAECRTKRLSGLQRSPQRSPGGHTGLSEAPPIVQEVLASPGQPLDVPTRAFMEPRFGHDFSQVRVHADAKAAESAAAVKARAYAVGQHVVIGEGQPTHAPTSASRHLLAHELAHVVQQSRGGSVLDLTPSAPHEREAHAAARAVATGQPRIRVMSSTGVGLARDEASSTPVLSTNPLNFPEQVIEMPWRGVTDKSNVQGYLRDSKYFWEHYVSNKNWAVHLSRDNQTLISSGDSPIVDDTWIRHNPQHAPYKGDKLIHHHIGQGSRTVAIPETLHRAHNVLHQKQQTVGTPTTTTKTPDPVPADRTETNVRKHSKQGPGSKPAKIRGLGISGETPPPVGDIPPSSAMSGMSPEELRPASATERADIARVDPVTGKVRNIPPAGGSSVPKTSPASTRPSLGSTALRGLTNPGLMGALNVFHWMAEVHETGHVNFGQFAESGGEPGVVTSIIFSPGEGMAELTTTFSSHSREELKTLTFEEAERTLKHGDRFIYIRTVNLLQGQPEWVQRRFSGFKQFTDSKVYEIWKISDGNAFPTGCKSDDGTNFSCPPAGPWV
jgi:hypothetical protein